MELLYIFGGSIILGVITLSLITFLKNRKDILSIPDDPGGKVKEPIEADPRDFKLEDVIPELVKPSEEEIKQLPKEVRLFDIWLDHTYSQGHLSSCTAWSLTHIMKILQAIDYQMKKHIELEPCDLRQKMGHNCINDKRGDYLENALKTLYKKGILGTVYDERKTFFIDGYSYHPFSASEKEINIIKWILYKKGPIYFAIKGNRKVWKEIAEGELKTIITPEQATGGHALCLAGYDENYFYIVNSWTPNYPVNNPRISLFKVSINLFKEAIQKGMFFWRFFVVMDKKDFEGNLFPDFNNTERKEAYEAVKWAKEKGIVKGVLHSDGKYYLEPYRPITRLEFIVMLYRYTKQINKND